MFPPHAGGGAPMMHAPAAPHAQSPLMSMFHGLAAHQMSPAMGHAPAPMQAPGAPMPLNTGGKPAATSSHMPTMMPR